MAGKPQKKISSVPRVVTVHFDPPSGVPGIGKGHRACNPKKSIRAEEGPDGEPIPWHAGTGDTKQVNCSKCIATGAYKAAVGSLANDKGSLSAATVAALKRLETGRKRISLDSIDFGAILTLAKALAVLVRQRAAWEHDGHLGPTGCDLSLQIGEKLGALESAVAAAGLATLNPLWFVNDKRRKTAVEALRELVRDWRQGYIGVEPNVDKQTPFTSDVRAKRLGMAVEKIEEFHGPPKVFADSHLVKLGSPPTLLQRNIWKALDGKALKKEDLAKACGVDDSRLYGNLKKTGGLTELSKKGLVMNKPGIGYYRPDAPPPT